MTRGYDRGQCAEGPCCEPLSSRLGASVTLLLLALIAVVVASQGALRRTRESTGPLIDVDT